jgi:hypothetical protein
MGLNNDGQAVGVYRPGTSTNRGFLYDNGSFTTVPPPGTIESQAWDINNLGHIVGDYWPAQRLGFLYDGERVISFDYPGTDDDQGTALFGINDLGVVVGSYFSSAPGFTTSLGFVASPIAVTKVDIDIMPGSKKNQINPDSRRAVRVAVLGSSDFDAPNQVDPSSMTFGRTGDESSLWYCRDKDGDVNGDGYFDLVCFFKTQLTGFETGDSVGILTGRTIDDTVIEGIDSVKIVGKRKDGSTYDRNQRDNHSFTTPLRVDKSAPHSLSTHGPR